MPNRAKLRAVVTSGYIRRWIAAMVVVGVLWLMVDLIEVIGYYVRVAEVDRETMEELATGEHDYDFRVALCAITRVRNEERTLLEWISYHTVMGYSKFYIYDDCSKDATSEILKSMRRTNENITIFSKEAQGKCEKVPDENELLQEMFLAAKPECDYVGVFDVDEFVTKQPDLYAGSLTRYLAESDAPCMRMVWWLMGNDGQEERPEGLVIESYKRGRWAPIHMKSICRANIIIRWAFSLWPSEFISKYVYIDDWLDWDHAHRYETRRVRLPDGSVVPAPSQPFFLKHYYVKSLEDYLSNRGARKFTSNGEPNTFYQNVPLWRSFSFPGLSVASVFTASMVPKTLKEMKRYTSMPHWPRYTPSQGYPVDLKAFPQIQASKPS